MTAVLTRRQFVLGVGAALLGGVVGGEASPEPAPTRGWRWRGAARSEGFRIAADAPHGAVGEIVRAPYSFNAIGSVWRKPIAGLRVRTSADGVTFGPWVPVTTTEMHGDPATGDPWFGDLVLTSRARFFQLGADAPTDTVSIDLIDASEDGTNFPRAIALQSAVTVPVISRAAWRADEKLRYDERGAELWTPRYFTPQKVVVHHTATANGEADPSATVRAVHYYHARTLGWGDIGYNYLIDRDGKIYEGRYGGVGVEAGHAYGHNSGSIGIACLGTFTSAAVPMEMRTALARLIADRARFIDPLDSSWFVDGPMSNLMGHRDAIGYRPGQGTACPGDQLYAQLAGLREQVVSYLGARPTADVRITAMRLNSDTFVSNGTMEVTLEVRNVGTGTVASDGPPSSLLYDERDTYTSRGYPSRDGIWRTAVDITGGGANGFPFRWGLPDALEPGASATIRGSVQLRGAGARGVVAKLVQEGRAIETAPISVAARVIDQATLSRRALIPVSLRSSSA
ncbi:MAG: N-acetylmuramoyl-L-alanine amidase [Chloroflexi bacterium]|nr:N-acetylmuramoyl-L-alanine amidase [Chloroflexota bacterium]